MGARLAAPLPFYGLPAATAALVVANVDSLLGTGLAGGVLRLAAALVLGLEGVALGRPRGNERRALAARLLARAGIGSALLARTLAPALLLLGVVFLGFAALELARAGQTAF